MRWVIAGEMTVFIVASLASAVGRAV
jgi:hypothetical protein